MTLPAPPAYRPELFVNRTTEITRVTNALRQIADGKTEHAQTIVFRGERGLGKSWLALHLHRYVLREEASRQFPHHSITSLLIHLTPPGDAAEHDDLPAGEWRISQEEAQQIADGKEQTFEIVLQRMLRWLAEQLDVVRAPYASVRDLSAWLAQDIRQKPDQNASLVICLILDSVFESGRDFLDHLERYVLAALAALPRVLIIMTGRGRPYLWKSPYLRVEREEQPLSPFSEEQVTEQIRRVLHETPDLPAAVRQLSNEAYTRLAHRIIALGGGYPLTSHLLAIALMRRALDALPEDRRNDAEHLAQALDRTEIDVAMLEQVANRLLEVVPADDRHRMREVFESLCILKDGFRENEMPYLLAARRGTTPAGQEYALPEMRKLRDRLLETNLVRWQNKRYVLDEAVRAVLEAYLKRAHPEQWRRLHRQTANLYQQWGEQYQSAYYRERAATHLVALQQETGKMVDTISHNEAQSRLERIKRLSFVKVRNEHFAPADPPEAERVNTAIIEWYTQQIDKHRKKLDDLYEPIKQPRHAVSVTPDIDYDRIATVQRENQQLLIDQLSYYLRRNPLEGFREYVRLTFYAVFTGNTMLDTQLQAKILAFLDERDPSGEQLSIGELERDVVQGVTAIRPVARLYAENDNDGVVREAQHLRQKQRDRLATAGRTTEAALNIWEALARTARAQEAHHDSDETVRLLDDAEQILNPIVDSTAPDVSEALQWRARSLLALLYHTRGFHLRARGQMRPAINAYRRAAVLWRQVDVPICLAWTLNNLGFAEVEEGNAATGLALINEALGIRRGLGARALAGISYATLSLALVYTGDYDQAKDNAERALRLCQAVEYRLGEGLALRNLAEALRRSINRRDPPEERMAVLRKAHTCAVQAYRIFEEIGDRLRQIESLIEKGCALRDMAGVRFDHPADREEYQELAQESVETLRKAAALAQETGNTFRRIEALVNIAYVGFNIADWEYMREGLTRAKDVIPQDYLITTSRRPDSERGDIRNRRLFTQLAMIHMLIGNRLFATVQDSGPSRLPSISHEYEYLASLFSAGATTPITSVEDALERAFRHYTLAFEYDRLYTLSDARAQRAQDKVYHQVKDLSAERLNIIKNAVSSVERDYRLSKSAMRDLLESRALFFEEDR